MTLFLSLGGIFTEHHEAYANILYTISLSLGPPLVSGERSMAFLPILFVAREVALGSEDTKLGAGLSEFIKHRELLGASNFLFIK